MGRGKVDFSVRSYQSEHMESPEVSYQDLERCLSELERINITTGAYRPVLSWLQARVRQDRADWKQPVRILDIGCGGGDTLRRIWRWARRYGVDVELTGIDINRYARNIAKSRTEPGAPITYEAIDIFRYQPKQNFDFIVSSLFTHHLLEDEIVSLLQWMCRHASGWFINDLHRHGLPYYFIKYGTALARFDRIVCHDAPVSVARGFTAREWQGILAEAKVPAGQTRIKWYFPFRYGVSWRRE